MTYGEAPPSPHHHHHRLYLSHRPVTSTLRLCSALPAAISICQYPLSTFYSPVVVALVGLSRSVSFLALFSMLVSFLSPVTGGAHTS